MRSIPVDTAEIRLIASGKVAPRPLYVELADGSRRRSPGEQAKNEHGTPLWVVDCFVDDDDDEGRAEIVSVLVPSAERPSVRKFTPVTFVDLRATAYTRDGRVAFSWRAGGIVPASAAGKVA